jgi:hypothetical protein
MKILLHMCCGPCAIVPSRELQSEGMEVMGFFYRYNIHPYTECLKREDSLKKFAEQANLRVIYQQGYALEAWLQNVVHREANRCKLCYHDRLRTTALLARRGKFDGFSSTLLYSKHQQHETIRSIGESVGAAAGGKTVSKFPKAWGSTGSNTAAAFTVKKIAIARPPGGDGSLQWANVRSLYILHPGSAHLPDLPAPARDLPFRRHQPVVRTGAGVVVFAADPGDFSTS